MPYMGMGRFNFERGYIQLLVSQHNLIGNHQRNIMSGLVWYEGRGAEGKWGIGKNCDMNLQKFDK